MKKYVDLHMHSRVSDGVKSPRELVEIAKQKNISVISLTDHDSVDGYPEVIEAGNSAGIAVVSGIELSCFDKKDTHVLGYNVNWKNPALISCLEELKTQRRLRMEKMVEALNSDGFDISIEDVGRYSSCGVIGRPHVASVLIEKGYGKDVRDVFKRFIGSNCKYYVPYKKLDVSEGIELIHKAGGVSVLAHPKLLRYNSEDFLKLINEYKELGLDGLEVYYPRHNSEHIKLFYTMATKLNMLITCGGDYHNDLDPSKNTMGYEMDLPGVEHTVEVLTAGVKV